VLISLIALVGGRIIPSFTRNRLAKQRDPRLPPQADAFDRLALGLAPVGLAAWVIDLDGGITGPLLLAAGFANVGRLVRWRGIAVWRDPLLFALHLGYAWLTLGLILLGLAGLGCVPDGAARHALGVGAIATMVLTVMSRTIMARRDYSQATRFGLVAMLFAGHLAAILRVGATALPDAYGPLLAASGITWIAGFAMFGLVSRPYLVARTASS